MQDLTAALKHAWKTFDSADGLIKPQPSHMFDPVYKDETFLSDLPFRRSLILSNLWSIPKLRILIDDRNKAGFDKSIP